MRRWMGICPATKQPFVGPEKKGRVRQSPVVMTGLASYLRVKKEKTPSHRRGQRLSLVARGRALFSDEDGHHHNQQRDRHVDNRKSIVGGVQLGG